MMSFGVHLTYGRLEPEFGSRSLFKEMVEVAKLADSQGFAAIWLPEHHLTFGLQAPNPLIIAGQLSNLIRCRVGTAISVVPYRHPLILAGEVAAADNVLDGRLDLGLGRGAYKFEFERFGIDFAESAESFVEGAELIRSLLSSHKAQTHSGKFYSFPRSLVWPRPIQTPPPIWIAAQTEPTATWAVRQGFNVMFASFLQPVEKVLKMAQHFHRVREECGIGRNEIRFAALQPFYQSEGREESLTAARNVIRRNRAHASFKFYDSIADIEGFVPPEPMQDELTPEVVAENTLIGTRDEIARKLAAEWQAGVDHVILQAVWGIDTPDAVVSMKRFAESFLCK